MLSELSVPQQALAEYMSALSERAYCAGWMEGLEFALWRAVCRGPFRYGQLELTSEHTQRLIELSERCGGWIVFHDERGQSFLPLAEWERRVSSATGTSEPPQSGQNAL